MSSVSTEKSCWKDSAEEERLLRAEKAELQCTEDVSKRTRRKGRQWHVWGLCASNTVFAAISLLLAMAQYRREECSDPSITIYSPAKEAVSYVEHRYEAALANKTAYMGFPDDEMDQRWLDLYDFGISAISKAEAQQLADPTIAIPGTTDKYLVQLEVFHNLHCLNDLRKLLYPERYHMLEKATLKNGTIDRNSFGFRHWDHCIDSLRQALMCNADISPTSFHVNIPFSRGFFPRLTTTHTCKDYSLIQEWGHAHQAPPHNFMINDTETLQQIIDESGFDHSPEENVEGLYWMFPGDLFFKYWREHPYEGERKRKQLYPSFRHTFLD